VFICDRGNSRVRKILTNGIIVTVAGNGTSGFYGDGGPASQSMLNRPKSVFVNEDGVFICDSYNHRIRRVSSDGIINTIVDNLWFPSNLVISKKKEIFTSCK